MKAKIKALHVNHLEEIRKTCLFIRGKHKWIDMAVLAYNVRLMELLRGYRRMHPNQPPEVEAIHMKEGLKEVLSNLDHKHHKKANRLSRMIFQLFAA